MLSVVMLNVVAPFFQRRYTYIVFGRQICRKHYCECQLTVSGTIWSLLCVMINKSGFELSQQCHNFNIKNIFATESGSVQK